jgi:hypothetical protein
LGICAGRFVPDQNRFLNRRARCCAYQRRLAWLSLCRRLRFPSGIRKTSAQVFTKETYRLNRSWQWAKSLRAATAATTRAYGESRCVPRSVTIGMRLKISCVWGGQVPLFRAMGRNGHSDVTRAIEKPNANMQPNNMIPTPDSIAVQYLPDFHEVPVGKSWTIGSRPLSVRHSKPPRAKKLRDQQLGMRERRSRSWVSSKR